MPMTSSYTYRPILRVLWRYMFALGLVGACVLLCLGIPKVMASRPFLAFWPVVVLAAEFGGIGPGLFATVASILCVHFILNPVFGGLNLFDWVGMTTGGIFLAGASVVSIFIGRKRNIKALQRLQSAAMQSATNGIALTDAQGVLLWANPAFCTITGYTSEEIIGKINWLLDSGEQNEAFLENLWSTVLQREVWHGDLVGRRKDGTTYVEERSVTPVTDADGRIINCVIIIQDITERKQAEDALRESENFIKAVMDSLPIGVAVNSVDPSVNFSYMNDNFPAIYHTTREALAVQDNFWNAVYEDPTFREEIRKRVLEDLASGEPERMHWEDIPISRKGEKTTYINARNTPLPGKQLMISTVWDITERKRAENALLKESTLIANIMETSPVGITTVDSLGRITFANSKAVTILGLSKDKISQTSYNAPMWQISDLDGKPFPDERLPFNIVMSTGKAVFDIQHAIQWPDGTRILLSINGAPILDANHQVTGMVASFEDITERKKSEDNYRALFREMFDSFALHDIICDEQGKPVDYRFIAVNPAFERMTGLKAENIVGRTVMEVLPGTERHWIETYGKVAITGEPVSFENYAIEMKKYFEVVAFRPAPNQFACIFADITERKQAEEELKKHRDHLEELVKERTNELEEANLRLQELDRLKSMFIASMSHELRTPLNSIIGFTGIILMGMSGEISAVQKKQLSMVKNSANHLLELINDVIDVSKIEAGKTDLSIGTFDLSDLTLEVKESFAITAAEKGLNLEYRTDGWVEVTSDPRRVKQILVNLVGNAVKFTETGTVSISVLKAEKGVEIKVRDTGIGMYREDMERLFLAFSRIHIKGRPIVEGTGLGLYLSRRIAALLGGEITAESEPDRGSEFTFFLPWKYSEGKV